MRQLRSLLAVICLLSGLTNAGSQCVNYYAHLRIVSQTDWVGDSRDMVLNGDLLLIAAWEVGLLVGDVSDEASPSIVATFETPGSAYGIFAEGDLVFIADGSAGLQVVDVSVPEQPVIIGSVDTPGFARRVDVAGSRAYVAGSSAGLLVIDVSDPTDPVVMGAADTGYPAADVAIDDGYAYVTTEYCIKGSCYGSLRVYDLSDLTSAPILVAHEQVQGAATDVSLSGDGYAYVGSYDYTEAPAITTFDVSDPSQPVLVGTFGPGNIDDLQISGRTLFAGNGSRLYLYDVTDPATPASILRGWAGTGGAHAVAPSEDGSIVATLADGDLTIYSLLTTDTVSPLSAVELADVRSVRVAENRLHAYLAGGLDGVHIIDIEDVNEPFVVGNWATPFETIDLVLNGNRAYVVDRSGGDGVLQVLDVSDVANPSVLASLAFEGYPLCIDYALNLVAIGTVDGLVVIDVADPSNPAFEGSLDVHAIRDVKLRGSFAYAVFSGNGLAIFDLWDPTAPEQISYISDSSPERVAWWQNAIYLVTRFHLAVIDASDAWNPFVVSEIPTPGWGRGVDWTGRVLYVVDGSAGVIAYDITSRFEPRLIGNAVPSGLEGRCDAAIGFVAVALEGLMLVPTHCGSESGAPGGGEVRSEMLVKSRPNPFGERTAITFDTPERTRVTLRVYDAAGRVVRTLLDGSWVGPGPQTLTWDGLDGRGHGAPAGVYFYRLGAAAQGMTGRVTLIR